MSKQQEDIEFKKIEELKKAEELKASQLLKLEEDAKIFDKKYQGVFKTVDYLLSGKEQKLIDGLIEDFSKPKGGISARSVFRMIGFAFRNPRKIGSLITMARNSSEIFSNNKFQQELLKSDNTWHFLQNLGENLPKIGEALANRGVKEFKEGAILDQKGLTTLQPALIKVNSRSSLRDIAIDFKNPESDQNKNIDKIVNLMLTNSYFKEYMSTKKESLKNYAVATAQHMMQPEIKYYKELERKGIPLDEQSVKIGKRLSNDIKEQMASFGIKLKEVEKLADLIPILMDRPADLQKFYASYSKKPLPDWKQLGSDIIEMAGNDEVKKFLINNAEILQNIMVATAKTSAQKYIVDYKITDSHLKVFSELVPILANNPEELQKLYKNGYGQPNYTKLTSDLLNLAHNNEDVKKFLKDNTQTIQEVMVNGAFATPSAEKELKKYNIAPYDLMEITDIVPILLDNPEQLKKFYEIYSPPLDKDGVQPPPNFNELTKEVLGMAVGNKQVQVYLKKNAVLFQEIMVNGTVANPKLTEQLNKYGIDKNKLIKITDIVPILLDNPEALNKFYDNFSRADYVALAKDLFELAKANIAVGDYLQSNNDIFKGSMTNVIKSSPILENMELKGELFDLFGPLLTSKNAQEVRVMVEKYEKSDWPGITVDFCKLIENDTELKKQLENNKGNLGRIAQAVVDNIPFVKQYTGDMKIDSLVANILKDPKGLREGIESYQKGGKDMLWGLAKMGVGKVLDSEFRGAVIRGVGTWILGSGAPKQQVVNHIAKMEPSKTRKSLNDIAKEAINFLDNGSKEQILILEDLVKKNQLFSRVKIHGSQKDSFKLENMDISESFANSTFINVSFKGSTITNSSFVLSSFKNVDFDGAQIDGATLKSMELQLQKDPKLLNGAKIIGEIPIGMNLSGVDLSGVDFSEVTSMKGVNLKDANLSSSILPPSKEIFEAAYNLQNAKMPEGYVTNEMIASNQDKVINLMLDAMETKDRKKLDPKFREKIVEIYKSETPIGEKMRHDFANDPHIISQGGFPVTIKTNFSELSSAASAITVLYKNKNDLVSIETKLYANIMADKITEKLFQKGDNRGQNALVIRDIMTDSLSNFLSENPQVKAKDIFKNPNFDKIVENLSSKIGTTVTMMGRIMPWSDRKQLPKKLHIPALIKEFKSQLEQALVIDVKELSEEKKAPTTKKVRAFSEQDIFNSEETLRIRSLAVQVGQNLFGEGHATSRKGDTEMIETGLREVFVDLKKNNNNVDISGVIEKNYEKLAGSVKPGTAWNLYKANGSGLSLLYYQKSDYTRAGYGTGGIKFDEKKILGNEFKSNVKSYIKDEIGEEIKQLASNKVEVKKETVSLSSKNTKELVLAVPLDKSHIAQEQKHKQTPSVNKKKNDKEIGGRSGGFL